MADVTGRARDRGQLLLISALGMAIMFVALALILNTGIYTENLATRSGDIGGGSDAIRLQESAQTGITEVFEYTNAHNNTTHTDLYANLSTGVDDWSNTSGKLTAARGTASRVDQPATVNGTRIEQTNATREFTNESGNATDWTLVTQVSNTREFRMNVPKSGLLDLFSGAFKVFVKDGSDEWRMTVSEDTLGGINVTVEHPGGSGSCVEDTDQAWINITDGTFNGTECDPLEFGKGLSTPYRIEFANSDEVNGTYHLIVDNETLAENPSPHFNDDDGSGSPWVTPAIYSTNITVTYQSPRLYYNRSFRIAPGEP